jgi:hypothetical protein
MVSVERERVVMKLFSVFMQKRERPIDLADREFNMGIFRCIPSDLTFLDLPAPLHDIIAGIVTAGIKRNIQFPIGVMHIQARWNFNPSGRFRVRISMRN